MSNWIQKSGKNQGGMMSMRLDEAKLKIELVPSTSWYNNLRKQVSRKDWNKIRRESYANANYQCEICGEKSQLHCHEKWNYNDEERLQKLEGFEAICVNCHMIKHAGFSMHTEESRQRFDRDKLIGHFCKVNNCDKNDFVRYEKMAFEIWSRRSQYQWKVDLGEYKEVAKSVQTRGKQPPYVNPN
jgi:hypothetical protein